MRRTIVVLLAAASGLLSAAEQAKGPKAEAKQEEKRKYNATPIRLWPLLLILDYGEPPTREVQTLWPMFKSHKGPKKQQLRLFPFVWGGRDEKSRYWHIWPLLGVTRKGETYRAVHVAWPFFGYVRDRRRTAFGLMPLTWYDRDPDTDSHTYWLAPLVWHKDGKTGAWKSGLVPLLMHGRDDKGTYHVMATPLITYGSNKEQGTCGFGVFPLLSAMCNRKTQARALILMPMLWLVDSPKVTFYHLWPLFGWLRHNTKRKVSVAWPLLSYQWDTETPDWALSALPLMSARRDGEFSGTAWLWLAGKPRDEEIVRRDVVLWKLMTYEKRKSGDHEFRILHFLMHSERRGDAYRASLLWPFFQYERDAKQRRLRFFHFLKIPL